MPTYEYACSACGHHWDEVHSMTRDPTKRCPKCGRETAKRQISCTNFQLTGKGWARDGYASHT